MLKQPQLDYQLEGHHGLMRHLVRLHPYSINWPGIFQGELSRLAAVLRPLPNVIEHIGSTAVPGLKAKPIIDILLGVPLGADQDTYSARLQELGYEWHREKGAPGRQFFSAGEPCLFHVHLVTYDDALWAEHLLFRNSLRADPLLALEYATLKTDLAHRFPQDRDSYTRGKAKFIENLLAFLGSQISEP